METTKTFLEERDEVLRQTLAHELQDIKTKVRYAKNDLTFANILAVMKSVTTWIRLAKQTDSLYPHLDVFREIAQLEHELFKLYLVEQGEI